MDLPNPTSPDQPVFDETAHTGSITDVIQQSLRISSPDDVDRSTVSDRDLEGQRPGPSTPSQKIQRHDPGCVEAECCISPGRNLRSNDNEGGLIKPCTPTAEEEAPRHLHEPQDGEKPVLMRRPGKGKDGTQVDLCVNCYPVKIADKDLRIFHYIVTLEPPSHSEDLNRKLKNLLQEEFFDEFIAYDGYQNLYIAQHTAGKHEEFTGMDPIHFHVCPGFLGRVYEMTITRVNEIRVSGLLHFLRGDPAVPVPEDCLQALETVVKDNAAWVYCDVDKYCYHNVMRHTTLELDLEEGYSKMEGTSSVWGLLGFCETLCPVECGLALNVDCSAVAFHARKCMSHYLRGRGIDPTMLRSDRETLRRAKETLAGLYVDVIERCTARKYRILGISHKPAKENELYDSNCLRETSIAECFQRKFRSVQIDSSLPCLIVEGGDAYDWEDPDPFRIPMGACVISDGQVFDGNLSDAEQRRLKLFRGADPSRHYLNISRSCASARHLIQLGGDIDHKCVRPVEPFGLTVEEEMIPVTGRVLEQPALMNVQSDPPRGGRWTLTKVYKSGRALSPNQWGVLTFGCSTDPDGVKSLVGRIIDVCNSMGIECFGHLDTGTRYQTLPAYLLEWSVAHDLERRLVRLKQGPFAGIDFVFCVIDDANNTRSLPYENFQRSCETPVGWLTQCFYISQLETATDEQLKTVALALNAQLGGTNTALSDGFGTIFRSVFGDGPVILFGADVGRLPMPNPLAGGRTRDVAVQDVAVVASMDWPHPSQYCARVRRRRDQSDHELSRMVAELAAVHVERNGGRKPQRAVFFVYGAVGDRHLADALNEECREMKRALTGCCPGVTVTWVAVRRSETLKFFRRREEARQSDVENVEVGTVVDSRVVHPWQWDFYLASHTTSAYEAVAEPTHYRVLDDENGFTADDIQKFVYYLCHTSAPHVHTVAAVPPVYYGELAAGYLGAHRSIFRGKPNEKVIDTMYFLSWQKIENK